MTAGSMAATCSTLLETTVTKTRFPILPDDARGCQAEHRSLLQIEAMVKGTEETERGQVEEVA